MKDSQMIQILYEAYGKELFLYLYSLCKNPHQAEDLLQETYVKALLSLSMQHGNMRAWLYLVARNLCFNAMKKEKHSVPAEVSQEKCTEPGILEQYIQKEQNRALYRAVARLPSKKREIVQLQYFSGLRLKEIAQILQISPENARVLSCRAKRELKLYLEEEGYELS